MAGAGKIIGVDLNEAKADMAVNFGMTDFINPSKLGAKSVTEAIIDITKTDEDAFGGVDYSFDATGNVKVMRDALECSHRGWGVSIIIGVAPAGAEISTRPFQLVTGRSWRGTAFGGARGRTDVPKIVDWYMDGKIEIDPMITHKMPLEDINKAFDDGTLTSERLVNLYLARIDSYENNGPNLNALITINEKALETARALDAERQSDGPRSLLHGIPVVLKDNVDTQDMPTTAGSLLLLSLIHI